MSKTVGNNGRFGNQFIRNILLSIMAERYNLSASYFNHELIKNLGIDLFNGTNDYIKKEEINKDNYLEIYNSGCLQTNLDPNKCFFQTKELTNFLYNYLITPKIRNKIIDKNPFKNRYKNNNDLFIHLRLWGVSGLSPGSKYYINLIDSIKCDNIYLSTDVKNQKIFMEILDNYKNNPKFKVIKYDRVKNIQFASTCKNIILSHGSFSAIIGYFSFYSKIYYPEFEEGKVWCGDMFSIPGWTKCLIDRSV